MHLSEALKRETRRLGRAISTLDPQTTFVLVATGILLIIQMELGSRRFFRQELAHLFPETWRGLMSWGWWFGIQGMTGFVIPVLALLVVFKRKPRSIGLGLGDWRFALVVAVLYVPAVVIGTWFLSDSLAFQTKYPHYPPAAINWGIFAAYELLFLMYWVGWEYLWRGFVLFGTAHTFGVYAIFVQAIPFTILHLDKPFPESILSLVGGIALGALVWRSQSFWIAVPIHAAQMMVLDFWCSLRIRTDISGTGLDALIQMFSG